MVISCNGSFIDMIAVYLGSYDRFSLRSIPIFFGEHCSEFACQSSQSFTFLQIMPIVQIVNSITYGRSDPTCSGIVWPTSTGRRNGEEEGYFLYAGDRQAKSTVSRRYNRRVSRGINKWIKHTWRGAMADITYLKRAFR